MQDRVEYYGLNSTSYSVGKGECFRDTILDALLFEGETILEC